MLGLIICGVEYQYRTKEYFNSIYHNNNFTRNRPFCLINQDLFPMN